MWNSKIKNYILLINYIKMDIKQLVTDTYNNPEEGFLSAVKLYKKLKATHKNITLSQVQKFVSEQQADQLTKQDKRPKQYNTVWVNEPGENVEIDLMIYDRYEWNHYKYILNCIDVHSRYLVSVPLTNRKAETIVEALKKAFKEFGAFPNSINADQEFNNDLVNRFLEKYEIQTYFSEAYALNHNPVVERVNRTLALMLQRWRVQTGSHDWPAILPKIVKNYNSTFHTTIKAKPIDVLHGRDTNKQTVYKFIPDFKLGVIVRYKVRKNVFAKGDSLSYSPQTFIIHKMKGNKIWLKNVETQKEIEKSFKPYELVAVNSISTLPHKEKEEENIHKEIVSNKKHEKINKQEGINKNNIMDKNTKRVVEKEKETEWEVEKIVDQQKGNDGKMKYRVHWVGYKPAEDTWEKYNSVKNTEAYDKWLQTNKKK